MSLNPDDVLFIQGNNATLELSSGGAASDVRSWVKGNVGVEGAQLFINNIAQSGTTDTIVNLHNGSVGIGTASPKLKLHVVGGAAVVGGLFVGGDLLVTGLKSFVQAHPNDPSLEIAFVALEGGEAGVYVRGSASLLAGKAVIQLPDHFRLATEPAPLTVQLTPRGQWLQLFTASVTNARLEVHESQGRDGQFDYFVQGIRAGYAKFEPVRKASLPRTLL